MKYLYRLLNKRNRGFTLVEMVISTALLSILVLGVLGFATPIMNMLRVEQQSARGTALAETIDSYINGTLRNAKMIQIVENVTYDRMHQPTVATDPGLTGLDEICSFLNGNCDRYEVRCLGICWIADQSSPYYDPAMGNTVPRKLMLVNIPVQQPFAYNPHSHTSTANPSPLQLKPTDLRPNADGSLKDGATKVFDDSMYFGLYPVVKFSRFELKDGSGNPTGKPANGYKITTEVYADSGIYNTLNKATRDKSRLAFTGEMYCELVNYKEQVLNPDTNTTTTKIKRAPSIVPDIMDTEDGENAYQSSLESAISSGGSNAYTDGNGNYYYPETFIYYVVSKDYNL